MIKLSDNEINAVSGGVGYVNMKLPKLKKEFENACKRKNMEKIMQILPELQARGELAWAKDTAGTYGIKSI